MQEAVVFEFLKINKDLPNHVIILHPWSKTRNRCMIEGKFS